MTADQYPLISAEDEWSPLKSVIVGRAEHSAFPSEPEIMIQATMPAKYIDQFKRGNPFPAKILLKAQEELNNLAFILQQEGIKVYRPKEIDWLSVGGYTGAMPRDGLMVVGNTLIEAPFAWQCRRNEIKLAYSDILKELSVEGTSRVCRAGQINGLDSIYSVHETKQRSETLKKHTGSSDTNGVYGANGVNGTNGTTTHDVKHQWIINNSRPAFDAADFMRFGKTVIGQLSHVTNRKGAEYLQALLPEGYNLEILETTDEHAMHIDATILPLRKGLLVYHPERVSKEILQKHTVFQDWELHPYPYTPQPRPDSGPPLYMCSPWLVLNALSLDENRILVEASDVEFASWVKKEFGMTPILCPFQHVNSIGGSFHCATVDLVRDTLK